jgi:hypothetical protein
MLLTRIISFGAGFFFGGVGKEDEGFDEDLA